MVPVWVMLPVTAVVVLVTSVLLGKPGVLAATLVT